MINLPVSVETEKLLIGALLREPERIAEIRANLDTSDFTLEQNRKTFAAIGALDDAKVRVNSFSVGQHLQKQNNLAHGQLSWLSGAEAEWLPGVYDVEAHVRELRDLSSRRRLITAADQAATRAACLTIPIDEILSDWDSAGRGVSEARVGSSSCTGAELIARAGSLDRFLKAQPGLSTPFRGLNYLSGGLATGELVIIAARPSVGKTALALRIGAHAAQRTGVLFCSLEMQPAALVRRLIASAAKVSYQQILLSNLSPEERIAVAKAASVVSELPMRYEARLGSTVMGIRAELQKATARQKIGLVIIDYLQLMRGGSGKREDRNAEISGITRGLKQLALDYEMPFVVLSQLTRGPARENRKPVLSDLRDSGGIEQDADLVCLMHREDQVIPSSRDRVSLIVAKHRNGETGTIDLWFDKRFGTFEEEA